VWPLPLLTLCLSLFSHVMHCYKCSVPLPIQLFISLVLSLSSLVSCTVTNVLYRYQLFLSLTLSLSLSFSLLSCHERLQMSCTITECSSGSVFLSFLDTFIRHVVLSLLYEGSFIAIPTNTNINYPTVDERQAWGDLECPYKACQTAMTVWV